MTVTDAPLMARTTALGIDDADDALTQALGLLDGGDPLGALAHSRAALEGVLALQSDALRQAREAGKTWEQIATRLGITRQAARKRGAVLGLQS